MSLANKAGEAGALMFFRKIWGALVNLGVIAYLARTLNKEDFGLVAISETLINFIQVFGISGIGEYLIYYNGEDRKGVVNSAFWMNFLITLLIVAVVLIVSPFWAESFNNPKIIRLSWMLLVGFFATSLTSIPNGIFRKSLNFKPMVAIQSIFGTISQLSSVLFAYLGFGVYSLALPNMVIIPVMCAVLFWKSGFRPSLKQLNISYWKNIFNYSKYVIGSSALAKFTNEGDTLLIGKLLGMESLGIYNIAYKLAQILSTHLLPIVTSVSFPVFAQHQEDKSVLRHYYLKMIHLISLIFMPAYGAFIIFAPQIIHILYGAKWNDTVLPFQILTCFAVFRTMSSPAAGLYGALGKPQLGFYINIITTPLFLFVIYLGSFGGLIWCCIFVMLFRNIVSAFHFYMSNRLLELRAMDFVKSFSPVLLTTLSVMFVFGILNNLFPSGFIIYAVVYFVSILLLLRFSSQQYFSNSLILIRSIVPSKKLKWKTRKNG